ncbi:hypothetical protein FHR83_007087 [Actinoplanes campanulatus]|uniref:Uncharacterized protein n=1 Tax=Actinoplanes campanulatus TaxID=113559 RepID=A0A7W5ANH7_9ACTN|nr:hypothetical protein [Actinoplanes campanulatus]MBB3099381.1 hypothetical protein [Actinoplanes campanulatus]GGN40216.1 hypothetical protein GCM10010109_69050 [Actinoplanes campanulatus]GID42410.1 hypothetical protein Aca09nite_89160 [Actinoplanes campanulatus]
MSRSGSPRAASRRHILKVLRAVRAGAATLQGIWDVSGTVYVSPPDRKPGENATLRAREAGEYPENRSDALSHLIDTLDDMVSGLTILRGQVIEQWREVCAEERTRKE